MEIPYVDKPRPDTGLYNAKVGIWLFLASEIMLFGALFSSYILLRIGALEGTTVSSTGSMVYLALRPLLTDFVLSMPRGAQVVYPKDAARIVGLANLGAGARVAEAGVGSGALTCSLLRSVGDPGHVYSYERREEFASVAEKNVRTWFGMTPANWTLTLADMADISERDLDAVVLDMLAPWDVVDAVGEALAPGGVLVAYVARIARRTRRAERLTEGER